MQVNIQRFMHVVQTFNPCIDLSTHNVVFCLPYDTSQDDFLNKVLHAKQLPESDEVTTSQSTLTLSFPRDIEDIPLPSLRVKLCDYGNCECIILIQVRLINSLISCSDQKSWFRRNPPEACSST